MKTKHGKPVYASSTVANQYYIPEYHANGRFAVTGRRIRVEGLNLVRNRKGRLPHIVVVTGEPTPNRISSIAIGTEDMRFGA